jgi:acyl carrier protein
VKIRGFRIELGEIEEAVRRHANIRDVVIAACGKVPGGKTLVAYVVPGDGFDKESLMLYLRGKLPEYMVPAAIVELDRLPLTSSGKIDKQSLPDPDLSSLSGGHYVAPRTRLEQTLAEIWQELLGIERVGIHDDFFELGGHSLLATRIVSAIRKKIEVEFAVRTFFQLPTIELMAQYISVHQHNLILEADDYQVIKL